MQVLPLSERARGEQLTTRGSIPYAPSVRRVSVWKIQAYRIGDELSGALIYFMVVFSPWALGTTQSWSIWTMNIAGYALGLLLVFKLFLRLLCSYPAPRWTAQTNPRSNWIVPVLAVLTLLILAFCLVSAANARATFDDRALAFEYHPCIAWLPHSLDSTGSWFAFWMYGALACFFWALRDWLLGKSLAEERAAWQRAENRLAVRKPRDDAGEFFPRRLKSLLWVLIVSGGVLAFEAILQRGVNSPKLLFLVKPRVHQTADGQFGPYAYRSNAAQYLNLLWPVAVGFWWRLNRARNRNSGGTRNHGLLAAAGLMAAGSVISTSRAGALIALSMAVLAGVILTVGDWLSRSRGAGRSHNSTLNWTMRPLLLLVGGAVVLALVFGWDALQPRMTEFHEGLVDREKSYEEARPMGHDYPWFGTGPGTFETVSALYPHTQGEVLWAQLHNDWLETRITFGWVGSALVAAAFACVVLQWFAGSGGIHGGRRFVWLIWLAMGGCLLHARFDFPFQIHSILLLFLIWCAVLLTFSKRSPTRALG